MPTLSPEQLSKLSEISNPLVRQRFAVFFQLPLDLQSSMTDEKTAGSIWAITKEKYQLADARISTVAKIIGLIFLGEMPIKNFIAALKNDLGVDVATAQAIAQDINQAIFQPVRESLMMVHGLEREPASPKLQRGESTPNQTRINADKSERDVNQRMNANDTKQMTNDKTQMTNQYQRPNAKTPQPQTNNDYESQRRREEVMRKIRPSSVNPPTAKPASFNSGRKNMVDLRNTKHKNKYDGFFT